MRFERGMKQTMFDTLLSLPLFQGLGRRDLTRILESTRLDFATARAGSTILRQDTPCTGLTFIMQGQVATTTYAADRRWSVEEEMKVPAVVGIDVLYGSTRTHRLDCQARTSVRYLLMDKRTVAALTAYFEVFRLNVLNLLTTTAVRREQLLWMPPQTTLEGRIAAFMRAHVHHPAGGKRFRIALHLLGDYLGEDPRYVSKALHRMAEAGLLRLQRKTIEVDSFETLINYNFNP